MFIRSLVVPVALGALLAGALPASAAGTPLELSVRTGHLRHGTRGTLVFSDEGIEYRTATKNAGRSWTYDRIKQIQIASPTQVVLRTYEDQGWSHLWGDRTVTFDVVQGQVTSDLVAFLLDRTNRPVVTSVLPPAMGTPRYQVPVKHVRWRQGTEGQLLLYDKALVYQAARPGASRYWRFADLASVFAPDRFRLEVLTYEGGGGDTRPFEFQLESDLPPGFYDALWAAINAPAPLHGGGR